MKRLFLPILFISVSLILVLVLLVYLPKNAGTLIFFFFFLVFNGYLWTSVRGAIRGFSRGRRFLVTALFWFPLALLPFLFGFGLFVSFLDWNIPIRTYIQSFLLVIFVSELPPMVTLIMADSIRLIKFILPAKSGSNTKRFKDITRSKPLLVTGWLTGLLIFTLMTAGTLFWQFDFRVKEKVITLHDLPPAFDGLKIVQISDIHLGSWNSKEKLREAMEIINGLNPDLIFFTGDMFNYCTAEGSGFEIILKTLQAPMGIYAIMGNHDYGDYITWSSELAKRQNLIALHAFYNNLGWKLLLNSNEILRRGSDSIALIGVDNWGFTRRFQRHGDIHRAQRGTESVPIQLLLSHDPSYWEQVISKKYPQIDVTFSGHTHGGQIGIDCCHIHWSPVIWISTLWAGLYTNTGSVAPQYLYVNQGLGNIGYSGRIGILPEITLFTLNRQK